MSTISQPEDRPGETGRALLAGLKRRGQASQRMQPRACGCRDPWPCRHHDEPESENLVDAGRDAAQHLIDCGLIPLLHPDTMRGLWRRGGTDRRLVNQLRALVGAA